MTPEQQKYVDYIKPYIESMTLEQLKAVRTYAGEVFERELRLAAEGMVAAFDERPSGEPEDITRTTQECALNTAKQILGLA
jgi:hypothetical protein